MRTNVKDTAARTNTITDKKMALGEKSSLGLKVRDNKIPLKTVAPQARGRKASITPISSLDLRIVLISIDQHNDPSSPAPSW